MGRRDTPHSPPPWRGWGAPFPGGFTGGSSSRLGRRDAGRGGQGMLGGPCPAPPLGPGLGEVLHCQEWVGDPPTPPHPPPKPPCPQVLAECRISPLV